MLPNQPRVQQGGRRPREEGRTVISYESAYRFVYGQSTRGKDYDWRRYLPRGKWKRGRRGRKGGSLGLLHPSPKTHR